jgi:hypothetical protein
VTVPQLQEGALHGEAVWEAMLSAGSPSGVGAKGSRQAERRSRERSRGLVAIREASQALAQPRLWVHGREIRDRTNRTVDIASQADPTARGLMGDVDPLDARNISQVSYIRR